MRYERDTAKIKKKLLLIFHKPLNQVDGQTKYLKELVDVISNEYIVLIPSEDCYKYYVLKNRNWILRTIMINIYLTLWVIKNRKSIKNDYFLCLMEDRYSLLPSLVVSKLTGIKLLSRISDWGKEYVDSFNLKGRISTHSICLLDLFYKKFVLNYSDGVIVPSEFLYSLIRQEFNKSILTFPLPYSLTENNVKFIETAINVKDEQHDIYCALIGNFNYIPNEESANFICKELAPQVFKTDNKIRFLIIGPGSKEKYSKYSSNNVVLMGMVDDLSCIYKQCQIGINLSKTSGGTSIKNIEYLVNGMIVISTPEAAIGVIRSNNLLIEDRLNFANTIIELSKKIRNNEIYADKKEVDRIRNYYSKDEISKNTLSFLEEFNYR